jgi:broad specificity phosphatase PhoE
VYLTPAQVSDAVGDGLAVDTCDAPHPFDATHNESLARFVGAVKSIIADTPPDGGDIVLVTHGFAFEALTSHHVPPKERLVHKDYCGYVVLNRECELLESFGVAVAPAAN